MNTNQIVLHISYVSAGYIAVRNALTGETSAPIFLPVNGLDLRRI